MTAAQPVYVPPNLERRSVPAAGGDPPFEYFAAGTSGPLLVCISALGQGLMVWSGLVDGFRSSRRLLLVMPRGTHEELPRAWSIRDHVADLERMVAQEGGGRCDVVTWCSGAKIGLEFARANASVAGVALTNGTYKPLAGLESFETSFEKTILELCAEIARKPSVAGMVIQALRRLTATEGDDPRLRELRMEPFANHASAVRYSHQVMDYLGHDIGPAARALGAPVLVVSGERDAISSPRMARAFAGWFRNSSYREVPDGSHYCLYENGVELVEMLRPFFEHTQRG